MKGKIKTDIDLIRFFEVTTACKRDVYLYTDNGDQLNLKSKLFQYVVVVVFEESDLEMLIGFVEGDVEI
ncbi:polya polymerase [Blautia schinkii]|nr:polya polymerase [Blautia schinkii]